MRRLPVAGLALLAGAAAALRAQTPAPPAATAGAVRPAAVPKLDTGLNAAFRLVEARRYAAARQAVEAYLAGSAPAHPGQARFIAGLAWYQQRLYERASSEFEAAARLEPDYVTTYFFQGFALHQLGRSEAARQAFERYLRADPEAPEALYGAAMVALEQDRVDAAEAGLQRALELLRASLPLGAPPSERARRDLARYEMRLADVHVRRDRWEAAREALERAVGLWPGLPEAWHKLARVRRRLGDVAGAERAQERASALQPRPGAPPQAHAETP